MPNLDWTRSMKQEFEYYMVDNNTWEDLAKIDVITKCTIDWDYTSDTIGSAKVTCTENFGEWYIRAYMVATQDEVSYRRAMGTFLILTPEDNYDGKISSWDLDAYSPLIELTETYPPLGYAIPKNTNIMEMVYTLCVENMRAPVVRPNSSSDTLVDDFVASPDETWLDFLIALAAQASYKIMIDEYGRVLFLPNSNTTTLVPATRFTNDNSSIMLPSVRQTRDLYSIPNKVDVVWSNNNQFLAATATNDDPYSPTSSYARGRYIELRETSPKLSGNPTQEQLDEYAKALLRQASILEYTVTYSHGYCDNAIGEGVMLHYPEAGIHEVVAKVMIQSIELTPGCTVQETAVYTSQLYKGG